MRRLSSGVAIPRLRLGVFQAARSEETYAVVRAAQQLGYRHSDTAAMYRNAEDSGRAIRGSGVPRADIFVTTQLWNADQGLASARAAFDASRTRLGLDVIDLYLLHWPVTGRRLGSWRVLESLLAAGHVRASGVSNFVVRHLDDLLARVEVVPQVNQVELSPFLQQRAVRARCAAADSAVTADSPLTQEQRLAHPVLGTVAATVARTPAQVLFRWGLQQGCVVLPKSVHPARLAEHAAALEFTLDAASMAALDALAEGLVTGWDPRDAP